MRLPGRVIVVFAAILLVVLTIGYLLPGTVTVTRSIVVSAPPEAVFPLVNSLRRSAEWSPPRLRDPGVELTFSGPASGLGSRMDWVSDDPRVGRGSQRIVASDPPRFVRFALDQGRHGPAEAWFALRAEEGGTRINWALVADMGTSPVARLTGLWMARALGADYERGLARLKDLIEEG